MMKENKFRAWDLHNKEWVLDDFWIFPDGRIYFGEGVIFSPDEFVIHQYINLKDKNDKEIYEGDLFNIGGAIYQIEYKRDIFVLNNSEEDYELCASVYCKNNKIIGNIYENPELIPNEE